MRRTNDNHFLLNFTNVPRCFCCCTDACFSNVFSLFYMVRTSLKNKKPLAAFKRRHTVSRVFKALIWGTSGIKLITRLMIDHSQLAWLTNLVRWHYKRKYVRDFYSRKNERWKKQKYMVSYWNRVRTLLPCSRKSSHARMGRGKGKIAGYFAELAAGFFLLEFRFTELQNFRRLCKFLACRLPVKFQGIYNNQFKAFRMFSTFRGQFQFQRRISSKSWLTINKTRVFKSRKEITKIC